MEMIVVVFFFILCSSICILTFVKSNNMSRQAKDLNQGVIVTESIAEVIRAKGPEGLIVELGAVKQPDGVYHMYWDQDWKLAEQNAGSYEAAVTVAGTETMETNKITVSSTDRVIYEIELNRYIAE